MPLYSRRKLFKHLGLAMMSGCAGAASRAAAPRGLKSNQSESFDFDQVKTLAELAAKRAYVPDQPLPKSLARLNYDAYRLIAFRHERAIWRDKELPFWTELHHRGFVHKDQVAVNIVRDGYVEPLLFDPRYFQYRGTLKNLQVPADCGFAGLRFLCKLPERPNYQEFCSFQGASYFRAIPSHEVYGSSARGLAVNIGLPQPEEFPKFRTLWIEQPGVDAGSMRMWALLDGPSVAGAYEFRITPGLHETTLEIQAQLYFRSAVAKLGLGPLTSMWMWDAAGKPAADHRPEVHDSDGLLIHAESGEWLWRPLRNPKVVGVARFQFGGVRGFGLLQRERRFEAYDDREALYHLRPGVWIAPKQAWGPGAVELLEMPSDTEADDNVAAYWAPDRPPQAGEQLSLDYRVQFGGRDPREHGGGRVMKTTIERPSDAETAFTLQWTGGPLDKLTAIEKVDAVVSTGVGRVVDVRCVAAEPCKQIVTFRLLREDPIPAEMRAFLRRGDDALSETWSYLCE